MFGRTRRDDASAPRPTKSDGSGGRRTLRAAVLAGVLTTVALAAIRFWDPTPIELLRLNAFDVFQALDPREPVDAPIAIVDVDEASLRALGQWPWPRTRIAELVDAIGAAGAVAIGFDILLTEPDRLSPDLMAEEVLGLDAETRARLRAAPNNDVVLAEAFARSRVVIARAGVVSGAGLVGETLRAAPQTSVAELGGDPRPYLVGFPAMLVNLPGLEASALGRGLISIRPEPDGVVRRVPAVATIGELIAPSLSIELLRVATGETTLVVKTNSGGVEAIGIGGVIAPTDTSGQVWLHFSPHDPGRFVSAVDVLRGALPPGRLAGRLVLVGTTSVGLLDFRATPLEPAMPGVEIHAQLIETLITGSALSRPAEATGLEVTAAVAAGVLLSLLAPRLGAVGLIALGLATTGVLVAASWRAFADQRLLIDPAYPALSTIAVLAAVSAVNYFRGERERDRIRGAFGRYLAPQVVERLAAHPERLQLGGETRELTLLFADVRDFTTLSERFRDDPAGLTALMNRLLTPLSEAILERGGTIDKYMGDAVMAFWNAPIDVDDHPFAAAEAAIDMRRRLAVLNAERAAESGAPPLEIGVGVNTGACVVGNVGSDLRFDYSALGDPVNLSARLQGLTKAYQTPILIGESTASAIGDRLAVAPLDRIRVKGKTLPETLSALLGGPDLARDPSFRAAREALAAALSSSVERDWTAAEDALAAARAAVATIDLERAGPAATASLRAALTRHAARLARYRAAPPSPDWDGVFDR